MSIILDGTNGEVFPSWATSGRPASPATGQTGYNTSSNILETYNGTSWVAGGLPTPSTSGNVLTSDGSNWTSSTGVVGVGQTWQDVTASRVSGTTYTNSTGKPIQVLVTMNQSLAGSGNTTIVVGGITIVNSTYQSNATGGSQPISFSFIVPNSATYTLTRTSGASVGLWAELR